MAMLGIRLNDVASVKSFITETEERLNGNNFMRNPFTGYIKSFESGTFGRVAVLKMSPLWPNFGPWLALFFLLPVIYFQNLDLMIFPLIFLLLSFFWTSHFFFLIFKAGLRKKGYNGQIKRMKKDDVIDELIRRS